jgi:hypothetical protein
MDQGRSIRSAGQLAFFFLLRQPYFLFLLFFIQLKSVWTSKQPNLKSTCCNSLLQLCNVLHTIKCMFVFAAALILLLEMGSISNNNKSMNLLFFFLYFLLGRIISHNKHKHKHKHKHTRVSRTRDLNWKVGIFLCSFLYIFALVSSMDISFLLLQFYKFRIQGLLSFISLLYSQNYYITRINKHAVFRTFSPYPHR